MFIIFLLVVICFVLTRLHHARFSSRAEKSLINTDQNNVFDTRSLLIQDVIIMMAFSDHKLNVLFNQVDDWFSPLPLDRPISQFVLDEDKLKLATISKTTIDWFKPLIEFPLTNDGIDDDYPIETDQSTTGNKPSTTRGYIRSTLISDPFNQNQLMLEAYQTPIVHDYIYHDVLILI